MWDQDGETAIQHPGGGTKITWGGPPVQPKTDRNRLHWVLATSQSLDLEIDRLRARGANVVITSADRAELVDPGGNEFVLAARLDD